MLESIIAVLASQDFWEKALLLIVGAALTGILVPVVKARLDAANAKRRKLLDAELARQSELIESQIKLLREFSDQSWKCIFAAYRVCQTHVAAGAEAQEEAYEDYARLSWELRTRIRAMVSEAMRLGSVSTRDRVKGVHDYLKSLEDKISDKQTDEASREEWEAFYYEQLGQAGKVVDRAIKSLARDLDLSSRQTA